MAFELIEARSLRTSECHDERWHLGQCGCDELQQQDRRFVGCLQVVEPAPVSYTAVVHQPIASEISVQSPVSQLQVEGLRWQAMADAYQAQSPVKSENSFGVPGPGLAGATGPQIVAAAAGTTSDGFNWSDAGIGAAIAFGAALMLLMAVILGRRFRSRPTGLAST